MFASLKRNNLQRKTRQCESNLSYASTLSNEEEEVASSASIVVSKLTKKKKLFLTFDSQTLFSAIVDITCKSNISEDLKLSRKFIHPV